MEAINVLNGLLATYRPGSFVTWSAEDIETATALSGDRTVAIIGEAEGGVPLGAYVITSAARAAQVLRGGELLDAVLLAFGAAGQNAPTVVAVNIRGGTRATLDIPGAVTGETFATLTTAAYRERANQLKATLFGTASTGYTVTLQDGDTGYYLSAQRVGLGLRLQYIGGGSAATAEVKFVAGTPTLVTTVTGADGDSISIPLSDSVNLTALCQVIQRSGPYRAFAARDGRLKSSGLDATTVAVDVKSSAGVLTAVKADFAHFFATSGAGEVTLELGDGATPPTSFSGQFSGGTSAAPAGDAWLQAMSALASVPLALIVPLTDSQTVLAGLRAELSVRNSAAQSKFTMLVGGYDSTLLPALNTPADVSGYVNSVVSELATVNDQQFQLVVSTGTTTLPASGQRVRLPLYLVAALLAGEILGVGIDESLTYRYVGLSDPFPTLDLMQTDALVRAGALCIELPTAGGSARVVRDRTTYSSTNNPVYESGLSVRVMNSVARGIKVIQDRYIPGSASAKRLADFQTAANEYLESRVELGHLTADGVDENGQAVAPYVFILGRTQAGGRHVISRSQVVPKSEFTVAEHTMFARSVEFQVSSNA